MTRVIAFANQKGGVAKTTSTLNLAVAFAEQGLRVLTVDLDPQGNLTMSQGLNPDAITSADDATTALPDCMRVLARIGDVFRDADPSDAATEEPRAGA